MKAPEPREGYVDRGMLFPAYPTSEQVAKIEEMQPSLRACWNWLVSRVEEVLQAREARAVREGLLPAPIPKPCCNGLQPEEAKAKRREYIEQCKDRRKQIFDLLLSVEWRPFLSGKNSEAERLGMKQGYQVLNNYLEFKGLPKLPALILMKLEDNFKTKSSFAKRKKFRRECDVMPIQVTSGQRIRLRQPGNGESWNIRRCNAEVYLDRVGWIAVYLDPGLINLLLTPGNTAREGCTLRYEHGRWYASIKVIRREIMHPGPGDNSSCGIDPGLDKLAMVSDGQELKNPRNLKYAEARELALSVVSQIQDKEEKKQLQEVIYRQDARQKQRILTRCRQLAARLCKQYEFIGIEENSGVALGFGSRYTGATKTLLQCLLHRCGPNRVRELPSFYNSQTCSHCRHVDKIAWERKLGAKDQTCTCSKCGLTLNRDFNAARNVNTRLRESLALD